MTSLILGVDASPRRIGWALIDYEVGDLVDAGVEKTLAGDDLRNRRIAVRRIASTARNRGDVFAVFVEDAYAGPNRRGTIDHATTVGNVEAFMLERWPRILVARIAPSSWRSLLGIARTGKAGPLEYAEAREPERRFLFQDEADALCIAVAGHALIWDGGVVTSDPKGTFATPPNGKEATGE